MPLDPKPQLVLLFGGPGAGKGTQARLLGATLGVLHISSGDLLRERQRQGASLGAMDRGELLPDDMVADLVFARLGAADAAGGAVLDGFPRNLSQAHALDGWLDRHRGSVKAAISLEVPHAALVRRIVDRHELSQRGDDSAGTAARRVEVFLQELPDVLAAYAARGLLHPIDGTLSIDQVHQHIMQALQA